VNKPKKILISPLDWGLGHATRCIPLISEFLSLGVQVIVAGTASTNKLIQEIFPELTYVEINGYNITYSASKWKLPFVIIGQLPKINRAIKEEHRLLMQIVKQHNIDLIISDNRYGFYHPSIRSIFITHQLQIQVPQSRFVEKMIAWINHTFIKKFNACWVVDYPQGQLAGALSLPSRRLEVKYLGILSRLKKESIGPKESYKPDILVLLSGPEPQRSILEDKLTSLFLAHTKYHVLIVRGMPHQGNKLETLSATLNQVGHLGAYDIAYYIQHSELVICRSGYSTLMDLLKLRKTALLIPTPGQTEQEYLAKQLAKKRWFAMLRQEEITWEAISQTIDSCSHFTLPDFDTEYYKEVLKDEVLR
jgi:uncharacterized protein (TIGR00661 family)